jgi:Rieske 2Fe-2S family protein
VFAGEADRIFGTHWICAARSSELAATGDFLTVQIAGESVILTRDERGELRAFFNVCRHRGTRICEADRGHFRNSIQCPYHAWTYALDGSLRAARNMDVEPDFDRTQWPLHQAAVAQWEGFVFLNLAPEPEPFERAFAPLLHRFPQWEIGALRAGHRIVYDLNCNWKLAFLNYSECYHCPLVHPQLEKLSSSESGRNDLVDGAFLGGYSELNEPGASLSTSGRRLRAPLGHLAGADLSRVYYYTIFPSMLLSLHPDYVMAHYVHPISADRTRVVCEWLFDADEAARPDFNPMDAVEFWDMTNRQDWHVNELTQQGMTSRAYTRGRYAPQEGLLHAFDRHYLRVMGA